MLTLAGLAAGNRNYVRMNSHLQEQPITLKPHEFPANYFFQEEGYGAAGHTKNPPKRAENLFQKYLWKIHP